MYHLLLGMFECFVDRIRKGEHVALVEGRIPSQFSELKVSTYSYQMNRPAILKDGNWKWHDNYEWAVVGDVDLTLAVLQTEGLDIAKMEPEDKEEKVVKLRVFCNDTDFMEIDNKKSVFGEAKIMFRKIGGYVNAKDCSLQKREDNLVFNTVGWASHTLIYHDNGTGKYTKLVHNRFSVNGINGSSTKIFDSHIKNFDQLVKAAKFHDFYVEKDYVPITRSDGVLRYECHKTLIEAHSTCEYVSLEVMLQDVRIHSD